MKVFGYPHLGAAGRLGNQLWQVAATISKARRNLGSRPWIPPDWEYRPFVRVPDEVFAHTERGDELIDMAAQPGGPYFQDLESIAEVYHDLREWFSPSDHAAERMLQMHGGFLERIAARPYAAIHVRRTDYLEHDDRFPQLTYRFRRAAVERVLDLAPNAGFLVFSDDPAWCRENPVELGLAGTDYDFVEGHVRPLDVYQRTTEPTDILDLFVMARCAAHIIANSTFSWWGAFLADSPLVLYPDRWYGDPSLYSTMWNCIPKGWIQLPC